MQFCAFELPVFWCQAAECLKFLCVRASVRWSQCQNIGLLANRAAVKLPALGQAGQGERLQM